MPAAPSLHTAAAAAAARAAAFLESVPDEGPTWQSGGVSGGGGGLQAAPGPPPADKPALRSGPLPWGDALAPPLFVLAVAGAGRILPFYVLVPALPLLATACLFGCAVAAAGVPFTRLPESRVVQAAVLTAAGAGAFCLWVFHAPFLSHGALAVQTGWFVAFAALYAHVARTDPGALPRHTAAGTAAFPAHHGGVCPVCDCVKTLRSRHCRACGVCVARFDHHCPAVGQCVGEGNQRAFTVLVCVCAAGQACYAAIAVAALKAAATAPPRAPASLAATFAHAAATSPGVLILAVAMAKLAAGSAFLAGRALRNAALNVTVAESARRARFPYLSLLQDAGPRANCAQFWGGGPRVDWSEAVERAAAARAGAAGQRELVPLALERAV